MSENKSVPSGGSAYSATCQAITLWSRDLRPETKSVRIAHVVGQNYENIWGARQRWSRLQRWPGTPAHIWVTPLSRTPTLVDPIDRPSEYSQRILNARVCVADGVIHGQLPGCVATFPQAYHRLGPLYCGQFGSKVSGHKQIGGRLHRGLDNASFSTPGGEATATVDFVSPLGADEDPEAGG